MNENKGFNVNIKDTVFIGKCQRMDWNTGRLEEIKPTALEVGQKVFYNAAYNGNDGWFVCTSEPNANGVQKLVEIGGLHRRSSWDVEHEDRSTAQIFGIGMYYDPSPERLTAEEIKKYEHAAAVQTAWDERKERNQKAADAAEREELRKKYAGILQPLDELKGYDERAKAEKANILAWLKYKFKGVRFTARKSYGSFTISWSDGPSVSAVESACSVWHDHTFNEYEDYNEYTPTQFNRLFGGVTYSIDTNRKNSPEAVQAAREALAALCPELAALIGTGKDYELHGDGQEWLDMTVNRRDDDQARAFCEAGKHQAGHWYRICPDAVLRVYLDNQDRTQHTTTPTDPKPRKAQNTDTTTDTDEAPADGLQLVEIPGGVAVIGDSRTTYSNRKAIKAHGARWNRDAQQWQATDPEAVAALRAWFGMDDEPTPDPDGTDDTAAPADNVTAAADDDTKQTAPADNYTTDTAESATEATESGKKYVFGFAKDGKLKEKYPDAVLMFRCGDFYELYEQDAHTAADLLGIITTDRPDGVTVCAFPYHALDAYLPRIIRAGHRVAICDQIQEDRVTKRLAKRGITATVSAGTAQTPTEAAQAAETGADEGQATEAQQSARDDRESESNGGELFTAHGETFSRGDRVTIDTTTDGHTTTEAGTLTDYARGQALAEVTTDDGRTVYGFFGSVKHTTPDPTPGTENDTSETAHTYYKTQETTPNFETCEQKPAAALEREEVTNPIKADDINTPRVLRLSDRRDIVTGCNDEQRDELVTMGGKETADGVTFRASKQNRAALHVWQNEQTRKQRAALLGEGWQWATLEHHGKEGDEICTTDGTRGTVTKSSPESICIEFETADGHTYSVAGHFVKTSPRYMTSETSQKPQTAEQNAAGCLEIGTRVLCKHHGALGTVADYNTRDGKLTYIVRYDKPQKKYDGKEYHTGEYLRDGITTNYDPETGRERVGSLEYYDELLTAEWWGNDTRDFDFGNVQISVDAPEDRSRLYREKWCVIIYEGDREAVTEWVHIRTLAALLAYYYEHRTTDQDTDQTPADGSGQAAAAATDEDTPRYRASETIPNFGTCEGKQTRHSITASERQAYADHYKQ